MSMDDTVKKYSLPSVKELELELGSFDEDDKEVQVLIDKLLSRSQKFTSFLEEMLHPDSTIVSMQEASMFSNEEREAMFSLFREIVLFQRKNLLLQLSTSEEEKAAYFKEFYAFWLTKKDQLKQLVAQALSVWSSIDTTKAMSQGYFG